MTPSRLTAPEPGWTTRADVVIVGSGIAGLTAALRLYGQVGKILVVTKDVLNAGSTGWAQGGQYSQSVQSLNYLRVSC